MAQYHFLVIFDTVTKKWYRDDETLDALLSGAVVYEPETDTWREPVTEGEAEFDDALSENLDKRLD
jgi:hypothetical protein